MIFLCYCVILTCAIQRFHPANRFTWSNKILIDSMLPYFIDTVVIQIKDIIKSNKLLHWRQINIS